MPQAIGLAVLSAVGATGSLTGIGSATVVVDFGFASFGAAGIIGGGLLLAAPVGCCFAVPRPTAKEPERARADDSR